MVAEFRQGVFNVEKLKQSLRFIDLRTLRPVGGVGTIAKFHVEIPGILIIKDCKLRRRAGEPIRMTTGRLEDGGFAVEIPRWLRGVIIDSAVEAARAKLKNDLAALAALEAIDETAEHVAPPHVQGLDVAALPAQLMRTVRV